MRQRQVLSILTGEWKTAEQLALDAGFATHSPRDTASKYANQLAKLDLAEKSGDRTSAAWRRSANLRSVVK